MKQLTGVAQRLCLLPQASSSPPFPSSPQGSSTSPAPQPPWSGTTITTHPPLPVMPFQYRQETFSLCEVHMCQRYPINQSRTASYAVENTPIYTCSAASTLEMLQLLKPVALSGGTTNTPLGNGSYPVQVTSCTPCQSHSQNTTPHWVFATGYGLFAPHLLRDTCTCRASVTEEKGKQEGSAVIQHSD